MPYKVSGKTEPDVSSSSPEAKSRLWLPHLLTEGRLSERGVAKGFEKDLVLLNRSRNRIVEGGCPDKASCKYCRSKLRGSYTVSRRRGRVENMTLDEQIREVVAFVVVYGPVMDRDQLLAMTTRQLKEIMVASMRDMLPKKFSSQEINKFLAMPIVQNKGYFRRGFNDAISLMEHRLASAEEEKQAP